MAREKFATLTEQMFYVLLLLEEERCGTDIMTEVSVLTGERVQIGAGTLYVLLDNFTQQGYIKETKSLGRKRYYQLTDNGRDALEREKNRMKLLVSHWEAQYERSEGI